MYLLMSSLKIVSSDYTQDVTYYCVLEHAFIKEKGCIEELYGEIHLYSCEENAAGKNSACGGRRGDVLRALSPALQLLWAGETLPEIFQDIFLVLWQSKHEGVPRRLTQTESEQWAHVHAWGAKLTALGDIRIEMFIGPLSTQLVDLQISCSFSGSLS